MNYYEHHLGDYVEATAHLTFVEDAAYARLIRKYYATERPIPSDPKAAARLIGARTRVEKLAVQAVLSEFFLLDDDGWHNSRCDEEIARYHEKVPTAQAKRDASALRQQRFRDRRKSLFEQLRELGVVPEFDASMADLEDLLSRQTSRDRNTEVTRNASHPVTRDKTTSQSPVPNINPKRPVDNGDNSPESGDVRHKALAAPQSAAGLKRLKPAEMQRPSKVPADG